MDIDFKNKRWLKLIILCIILILLIYVYVIYIIPNNRYHNILEYHGSVINDWKKYLISIIK